MKPQKARGPPGGTASSSRRRQPAQRQPLPPRAVDVRARLGPAPGSSLLLRGRVTGEVHSAPPTAPEVNVEATPPSSAGRGAAILIHI